MFGAEAVGFPDSNRAAQEYVRVVDSDQWDRNWRLNDHFGSIYVINLAHKTERMERAREELSRVGVTHFTRFEAVNGRFDVPESIWGRFHCNWQGYDTTIEEERKALVRQFQGEAGCYLSHLEFCRRFEQGIRRRKMTLQQLKMQLKRQMLQKDCESIAVY